MVEIEKVFLWKPTKINGKWKWLRHVSRAKEHEWMVVGGKYTMITHYRYLED